MPSPLPSLIDTLEPLPSLPPGYGWEHRDKKQLSALDSFVWSGGIDSREVPQCLVCGEGRELQHCRISTSYQWVGLRNMGWLPPHANGNGADDPRNAIPLCKDHHHLFNNLHFFIRFFPDTEKFVVVSFDYPSDPVFEQHSGTSIARLLEPFHGKAIPLDVNHPLSPFPSLFLQYELRSRAAHLFTPTLDIPDSSADIPDQDWMSGNSNIAARYNSRISSSLRWLSLSPLYFLFIVRLFVIYILTCMIDFMETALAQSY